MNTTEIMRYAGLAEFAYSTGNLKYQKLNTFWEREDNHEAVVIEFPNELVIAVRGTEPDSLQDWITNLMFLSFRTGDGIVKIHGGFNDGAEKLYKLLRIYICDLGVKKHKQITFVGHSAGGAKARVLSYLCKLDSWCDAHHKVVTFGCPKTGNSTFNSVLNDLAHVYHFTHKNDIVPYLPLFHGTHDGFDELRICGKQIQVNPNFWARLWGRILAFTQLRGVGIINHLMNGYCDDLHKIKKLTDKCEYDMSEGDWSSKPCYPWP